MQILYPSRQNLGDHNGIHLNAIAFKRIHPDGSAIVSTFGSLPIDRVLQQTYSKSERGFAGKTLPKTVLNYPTQRLTSGG
ncbi:hypothetical protein [Microcoleus vaginatus]|uniref:hypothetical protein n=1 Tax=Microcoleus vaginatus TaxID=119532 RepID=UPI0032A163A5